MPNKDPKKLFSKIPGIAVIIILLCPFLFFAFQNIEHLTPAQLRGKLIYTTGKRTSGEPIKAQLSGARFDASILPCSNCHGMRGEGNPEGGVDPSPLDWSSLTKSYSVEFDNGRKRKAYDKLSLKRAIEAGIDPSNNELDLVMPRYSLSDDDVEDLISYLKIIGSQNLVGVTDSSIHMGVILPSKNRPFGRSDAVIKTMEAYLDLVNSGGGLYNRKFYLSEIYAEEIKEKSDSTIIAYLDNLDLFAFIASDLEGLPRNILSIIEDKEIPIVGAISGNPEGGDYLRNNFYYLLPGLNQEVQSLVNYALEDLGADYNNFAIVLDSSSSIQRKVLKNILGDDNLRFFDANTQDANLLLQQLKNEGIHSCLYLGDANKSFSFLNNLSKINWYPNLLLPGKSASPAWLDAPLKMDGKIYFSYPTWFTERNEKAMNQYSQMASNYDLDNKYINAQLNSLASTILFTETLKLSGKEFSRESMIETLHNLQDFQTGFISPLSFGPNKRIGSEKVFIVEVDVVKKRLVKVN